MWPFSLGDAKSLWPQQSIPVLSLVLISFNLNNERLFSQLAQSHYSLIPWQSTSGVCPTHGHDKHKRVMSICSVSVFCLISWLFVLYRESFHKLTDDTPHRSLLYTIRCISNNFYSTLFSFHSDINRTIQLAEKFYTNYEFKEVLKTVFYEFQVQFCRYHSESFYFILHQRNHSWLTSVINFNGSLFSCRPLYYANKDTAVRFSYISLYLLQS